MLLYFAESLFVYQVFQRSYISYRKLIGVIVFEVIKMYLS